MGLRKGKPEGGRLGGQDMTILDYVAVFLLTMIVQFEALVIYLLVRRSRAVFLDLLAILLLSSLGQRLTRGRKTKWF